MTTEAITPLRQRMIEDMNAPKLCAGTQRGHIRACKRFAAFLKRSPDTATLDDIRRFQLHLRHYGLLAKANCAANIARARQLLAAPSSAKESQPCSATATDEQRILPCPCPCCGGRMIIIESFARGCQPKHHPTPPSQEIRIDSS